MPKKEKWTGRSCSIRSRPLRPRPPPRASLSPWKPTPAWATTAFFQTPCQKNISVNVKDCSDLKCVNTLFFLFCNYHRMKDSCPFQKAHLSASVNHQHQRQSTSALRRQILHASTIVQCGLILLEQWKQEERIRVDFLNVNLFLELEHVLESHSWLYIKI